MDILKVFGENVKFYRTKKGISQEKFGEMCNLHRTYISDIERFNRNISRKYTENCRCTRA